MDRDSSVGIATRYELHDPGIESRTGEICRRRPDRSWGSPSLLYNGYRVSFSGLKRPKRGVNHPTHPARGYRTCTSTHLLRKISPPPSPGGIRSPARPAHTESLYRLRYRGPLCEASWVKCCEVDVCLDDAVETSVMT
jgi:hypothetical protein